MAQLDETFGEGSEEKLQELLEGHSVPDGAREVLLNIALTMKPSKKDFFQAVTEVQKAHKIENVFYLKFADYVSALGKKGRTKMNTEKKTRARKQSEEMVEIPRYSVAAGAEGVTFTIPWDEVRKHLGGLGGVGEGVGSKEPVEPLTNEQPTPALTLVQPAAEKPGTVPPGPRPEPEAEAPLPQSKPEMLASLPPATGNREPANRAELVSWYIAAICGGARYGGEPSIWDRILFNSTGARRRIVDVAQRSGATVEQTMKFLKTQYDPSIVKVEIEGDYVKVELGVDIEV